MRLPACFDVAHLARQFLPAYERTVQACGVQILHGRYWHPVLAPRIGQQITVHHDERTLQEVYAEIDGCFVPLPVVGHYPDISEPECEAGLLAPKARRDPPRSCRGARPRFGPTAGKRTLRI